MGKKKEKKPNAPSGDLTSIVAGIKKGNPSMMVETAKTVSEGDGTSFMRTGVFTYDLLTKGIPDTNITTFKGPTQSGKTTHLLRIMGEFLRKFPNRHVALVSPEGNYDPRWVARFVDADALKRLLFIRPDYGEQAVDTIIQLCIPNDIGLIGVDSLASLFPIKEVNEEASASNYHVGGQARLVKDLFQRAVVMLSKRRESEHPCGIICLNQMRDNIGGSSGFGGPPPKKMAGGNHPLHFSDQIVHFNSPEYALVGTKEAGTRHAAKVKCYFTLEKNRLGPSRRYGVFTYYQVAKDGYAVGEVEEIDPVFTYAQRAGLIFKDSSMWKVDASQEPTEIPNKQMRFKSKEAVKTAFKEDYGWFLKFKEDVLDTYEANPELLTGGDNEEEIEEGG